MEVELLAFICRFRSRLDLQTLLHQTTAGSRLSILILRTSGPNERQYLGTRHFVKDGLSLVWNGVSFQWDHGCFRAFLFGMFNTQLLGKDRVRSSPFGIDLFQHLIRL